MIILIAFYKCYLYLIKITEFWIIFNIDIKDININIDVIRLYKMHDIEIIFVLEILKFQHLSHLSIIT